MSEAVEQQMRNLMGILKKLGPKPTDTLRTMLASAPADSEAHRLAAAFCRCGYCGTMTPLIELIWLEDAAGDLELGCPKCEDVDHLDLLETERTQQSTN